MKLFPQYLLLAAGVILAAGCSDAPDYGVEVKKTPAVERVRSLLEGYAQRGRLDSSARILKKQIKEMKKEGAANIDALLADAEELLTLQSPAAIREKAKEMLAKLPKSKTGSTKELPATE